jgi:hypothetical protein
MIYERVVIVQAYLEKKYTNTFFPSLPYLDALEADLIVILKRKILQSGLIVESFSVEKDRYQLPREISKQELSVLVQNAKSIKTIVKKRSCI